MRFLWFLLFTATLQAAERPLTDEAVRQKADQILQKHLIYSEISDELARRVIMLYPEKLDPTKTYFLKGEISDLLDPSKELVQRVKRDLDSGSYAFFYEVYERFKGTVPRHERLMEKKGETDLGQLEWQSTEQGLSNQMRRVKKAPPAPESALAPLLKAIANSFDPHTAYLPPGETHALLQSLSGSYSGIGVSIGRDDEGAVIMRVIPEGPADGILFAGDRILAIDGHSVEGFSMKEITEDINHEGKEWVKLQILRLNLPQEIVLKRSSVSLLKVHQQMEVLREGKFSIGYIRYNSFFKDKDFSGFQEISRQLFVMQEKGGLDGVILDMRSNSGGFLPEVAKIAGLFLDEGVILTKVTRSGVEKHVRDLDSSVSWEGPLIIIVDRMTASAAEILAAVLQDYGRAIVVGDSQSYGKGTFQTPFNSEYGMLLITTGMVFTVSGRTPQIEGVESDIVIPTPLADEQVGERYLHYPIPEEIFHSHYKDTLEDKKGYEQKQLSKIYPPGKRLPLYNYQRFVPYLKEAAKRRGHAKGEDPVKSEAVEIMTDLIQVSSPTTP